MLNGWLAGTTVPSSCTSGVSPDFYNEDTGELFTCAGNVYVPIGGGGGGGVTAVFGRTGSVVAVTGDYTAAQVTNAVDQSQVYNNPTWIGSLAFSKITGVPAASVSSVFGRTGAVVQVSGDYTAAQVTNAVDTTQSYANPVWITSLAYSKLTGVPPTVASFNGRTGAVVPTLGDYTAAQVTNAVDTTQTYSNPTWITSLAFSKITGFPSTGSFQTPWLQQIDAATFGLINGGAFNVASLTATGNVIANTFISNNNSAPNIITIGGTAVSWGSPLRWEIIRVDAEGGGNTGSNLALIPFTDTGVQLPRAVTFDRSDSTTQFGNSIGVGGPALPPSSAVDIVSTSDVALLHGVNNSILGIAGMQFQNNTLHTCQIGQTGTSFVTVALRDVTLVHGANTDIILARNNVGIMRIRQAGGPTSVVNIIGLPTSATGLVSGDVWNNAGVLNIV